MRVRSGWGRGEWVGGGEDVCVVYVVWVGGWGGGLRGTGTVETVW